MEEEKRTNCKERRIIVNIFCESITFADSDENILRIHDRISFFFSRVREQVVGRKNNAHISSKHCVSEMAKYFSIVVSIIGGSSYPF